MFEANSLALRPIIHGHTPCIEGIRGRGKGALLIDIIPTNIGTAVLVIEKSSDGRPECTIIVTLWATKPIVAVPLKMAGHCGGDLVTTLCNGAVVGSAAIIPIPTAPELFKITQSGDTINAVTVEKRASCVCAPSKVLRECKVDLVPSTVFHQSHSEGTHIQCGTEHRPAHNLILKVFP